MTELWIYMCYVRQRAYNTLIAWVICVSQFFVPYSSLQALTLWCLLTMGHSTVIYPDSKVHGANIGLTRDLSAPDGPHVSPMNLAIRVGNGLLSVVIIRLLVWKVRNYLNQKNQTISSKCFWRYSQKSVTTSWNGTIFRVTGLLCGEITGHRWIPHTKASDAELWCFLWSEPE